ncbi:NADPH-dependent FMN reductase [Rhizobium glycinendophyticum]|uniref:NAD(P)H-dependent oxidoreductase n=1 Tax=Rhizobium glycinendophyticum TaxID=2589807 RepID=A0A504UHR7_9HYPH|nr:NADPH-dependent FMN reductase [Rhizobium glycinendophyticum]TPP10295.1 NAD(P)H-dependent oxidoreductase [Rhizobium glycinendophyticum]
MNILAISGSARGSSTNTAMLRAVAEIGRPAHDVTVFSGLAALPVFSPDLETAQLPDPVQAFVDMISQNDGLIIASPEYVRSIPGGLKNAIDWLVSRDEIINKPIALMHASHRGDDMLDQLRIVLSTVSARFCQDLFLRFPLMKMPPEDIQHKLHEPANRQTVSRFLTDFAAFSAR